MIGDARSRPPRRIAMATTAAKRRGRNIVALQLHSERPDRRIAPTTPAAGPPNSAVSKLLRVAAADRRPPLDCITQK
jgi:hypothetical protein